MAGSHDLGGLAWHPDPRLLDSLHVAVVAFDLDGSLTYLNGAATTLFGPVLARAEVSTGPVLVFDDSDVGAADEVLGLVLSGGVWAGDLAMLLASGESQVVSTSWSPVHRDGKVAGAVLLAEPPTTSDDQARQLAARLSRLAAVTTDLLFAESIEAVTRIVTEHMTRAASATVGSLSLLVDDETLALMGIRGGREGVASRWATYSLNSETPAAEAVRTGRTLLISGSAEIQNRYPDLETAAEGERSIVALPLLVASRALGVVTLSFPGRRVVDAAELQFLSILADTCAQAIDRIQAVGEAADREAKLRFLSEASVELAKDLDYEATLRNVAELAVPWFADWCAIALEADGELRTTSVAHANPANQELVMDLQTKYPISPDAPRGGYQVFRSGESDLIPEISDELLAASAQDEEHLAVLRSLHFRSAMVVPLKVSGRSIGVITWVAGEHGRRFTEEDVKFGEDLARRAAVAIDNAQLHSQLRDVALRLQRAVLPEHLPPVPGWELAVQYHPAGRTGAGGDFYDVIPLNDGRLAFFVGDVMGRGVEAASVMAQMRSAVRTLAAIDPQPATLMRGLDRVFDHLHLEQLVTVVYGVADPAEGTIELINAGHPCPLLISPTLAADEVAGVDTLILGVGGGERTVVTRPFGPGETLLLFTDGLIERRNEHLGRGMERLAGQANLLNGPVLADRLEALVKEIADPDSDDDIAALAIRMSRA